MPDMMQKPSFIDMMQAMSERIENDTLVELVTQCKKSPSVVTRLAANVALLHRIIVEAPK